MPRKKKYDEAEVIQKAMNVFWLNGYTQTSARMLEQQMGINLFSIYSAFQNKDGVFLETVKRYKRHFKSNLLLPLSQRPKTTESIQQFFYDFLQFTQENNQYKGCLLINAANELRENMNEALSQEIAQFSMEIKDNIYNILLADTQKNQELVMKQTNFLFVSLQGLALTSKFNPQNWINDYIEMTFKSV